MGNFKLALKQLHSSSGTRTSSELFQDNLLYILRKHICKVEIDLRKEIMMRIVLNIVDNIRIVKKRLERGLVLREAVKHEMQ